MCGGAGIVGQIAFESLLRFPWLFHAADWTPTLLKAAGVDDPEITAVPGKTTFDPHLITYTTHYTVR